jgi:hypothetical protein
MPLLVRLTYASTVTSTPGKLREELTSILGDARRFNYNHNIHGVLFYGNSYFYQCIEGNKAIVDQLYQKILKDSRHKDIKQLSYEYIAEISFDAWNMKYVLLDDKIRDFFIDEGMSQFNPYKLDEKLNTKLLSVLLKNKESVAGQEETMRGFTFSMQGRSDNLKYMIVVLLIGMLILSLLYLSTIYLVDFIIISPKLGL